MKSLLIRWVLLAVSVFLTGVICAKLSIGFEVDPLTPRNFATLLVGVAVLSVLNATLGRVIRLVTLPLSCLTLGLFSLVVNAIVLYVAAQLHLGFSGTFIGCLIASLLISFLNGMLGVFLPDGKKDD